MTDGLREEREEQTELILPARAGHGIWVHRFEITIEKLTDVLARCDVVLEFIPFRAH